MAIIHNPEMRLLIKPEYTRYDILALIAFLKEKNTFHLPALSNGLFPASIADDADLSGYGKVWVRDNIFIANAYFGIGQPEKARAVVTTLCNYFKKYRHRFENIINGFADPSDFMHRPHIRFDGAALEESGEEWNHAQNDALGYFLWFYSKMLLNNIVPPETEHLELLDLFPLYFNAIRYWIDEDSGHWEEEPKIEASSIGVVLAGLKELKAYYESGANGLLPSRYKKSSEIIELLSFLIAKGEAALSDILPFECSQLSEQRRRYDAALLFLIFPLDIVDQSRAQSILSDVKCMLEGDYGIRRYLKDSFWCRNYLDLPHSIRTARSSEREAWLKANNRDMVAGEEAQWCIFDPVISSIYGLLYRRSRRKYDLDMQIHYLNRALGQLTTFDVVIDGYSLRPFQCPELYFLDNDMYVPNASTPLLWTQANLMLALYQAFSNIDPG